VPIGLVSNNWGGTPVQSWSSAKALSQCNGGKVAGGRGWRRRSCPPSTVTHRDVLCAAGRGEA
jgi:hypothetical protein